MPSSISKEMAQTRLGQVSLTMDETIPDCPSYHPLSDLQSKPGYYPNIDSSQHEAAKEILQCILAENLDFNSDEEWEFLKILRFLRARKFNVKDTMEMIREDVIWRAEKGYPEMNRQTASSILKCDISLVYRFFPSWVQGIDKQHRPVSWRKLGKLDMKALLKLTTMELLVDLHSWDVEQLLRKTYDQSEATGLNIETFTIVIDVAGWTVGQASRDAYTFIKGMVVADSDHYPERLGSVIIINAPAMLSWAWRIVHGFLTDVQKTKVRIYGCDTEEWQAVLFETIGQDQIPVAYGGTLPNMTLRDALATLDPPPVEEDQKMQIMCGLPTKKRKKQKKKAVEKKVEVVKETSPKEAEVSGKGVPQKPAWARLFTCAPPQCNGGDDNHDYFISTKAGTAESSKNGEVKDDAEDFEQEFSNADEWDERSYAQSEDPARSVPTLFTRAESNVKPAPASPKAVPVTSTKCESCAIM